MQRVKVCKQKKKQRKDCLVRKKNTKQQISTLYFTDKYMYNASNSPTLDCRRKLDTLHTQR